MEVVIAICYRPRQMRGIRACGEGGRCQCNGNDAVRAAGQRPCPMAMCGLPCLPPTAAADNSKRRNNGGAVT